MKLKLAHSG